MNENRERTTVLHLSFSGLSPQEIPRLRERLPGAEFRVPRERVLELAPFIFGEDKEPTAAATSARERNELQEEFDGALFAHAYGLKLRVVTMIATWRQQDADAIMLGIRGRYLAESSVQVKSVMEGGRTLNEQIAELVTLYPRSPDLIVVIAVHAAVPHVFKDLYIPPELNLRELWVMHALDPKLDRWRLCGDLLLERGDLEFYFDFPG